MFYYVPYQFVKHVKVKILRIFKKFLKVYNWLTILFT